MTLRSWLVCALALAACGDDPVTVVFVTIDARPAVRATAELEVTIGNDNATIVERFDVDDRAFPITFTVTPTGRDGNLTVDVVAVGDSGTLRATGSGAVAITADQRSDLTIMLEPSDFVVNTNIAGIQRPTFVAGRSGRQLATGPAGEALVVFVNDCSQLGRCDVFARRFAPDAVPARNGVTMDEGEFIANLSPEFAAVPGAAVGPDGMFVSWTTGTDIRGVALTAEAVHTGFTDTILSVAGDLPADPAGAGLADGSFVVVWSQDNGNGSAIRGRLVGADGQPIVNPITGDAADFPISTAATGEADLPAVVATGSGRGFVVVWRDRGALLGRFFDDQANPRPQNAPVLALYETTATLSAPQIAWNGSGVMVTWAVSDFATPALVDGQIKMRTFLPPLGGAAGAETVIAARTFDDFVTPDIAARPDGAFLVTWHDCGSSGDGSGCGIFGQVLRPGGLQLGQPLAINTTSLEDQTDPSVAATPDAFMIVWADQSEQPPDSSQGAVRGRVIYPYPDLEVSGGARGARCGSPGDDACAVDLACMAGSSGTPYCHDACDPSDPSPCPGGGVCTTMGSESACIF